MRAEGKRVIGWDSWMVSPMQWTWAWANFRRWWGTGKTGMLLSMGHKESYTPGWLKNNNLALQLLISYFDIMNVPRFSFQHSLVFLYSWSSVSPRSTTVRYSLLSDCIYWLPRVDLFSFWAEQIDLISQSHW